MEIRQSVNTWPVVENTVPTEAPTGAELTELRRQIDRRLAGLHLAVERRTTQLQALLRIPDGHPVLRYSGLATIKPLIDSIRAQHTITETSTHEQLERMMASLESLLKAEVDNLQGGKQLIDDDTPGHEALPVLKLFDLKTQKKIFLLSTMLRSAETVPQVTRLIKGFAQSLDREIGTLSRLVLSGAEPKNKLALFIEHLQPEHGAILLEKLSGEGISGDISMCTREDGERDNSRNTEWIEPFVDALDEKAIMRYGTEPYFDSAAMIMADPRFVFTMPSSMAELAARVANGGGLKGQTRKVPEAKRMTEEKLNRLLQLPGLKRYIDLDANRKDPRVFGTNLTILAEFFCETEDAERLNEVTPEDIEKWLVAKFEKHQPSTQTAFYQWARIQGTKFEEAGEYIEQYILDQIDKEHSWMFAALGTNRETWRALGGFFHFVLLITTTTDIHKNLSTEQLEEIRDLLPSEIIFGTMEGNPAYEAALAPVDLASFGANQLTETLLEKKLADIASRKDPNEIVAALIPDEAMSTLTDMCEWESDEGFELLDPRAITLHGALRKISTDNHLGVATYNNLDTLNREQILAVRERVLAREAVPRNLVARIDEIIETRAGDEAFEGISTETLVDIADNEAEPEEIEEALAALNSAPSLILPDGSRHIVEPERLGPVAELSVLRRHLDDPNVRGGREIIKFLRAQRRTLHPVSWVMPVGIDEDVNLAVIKEFGSSPDLPHLLQTASILATLGLEPAAIFEEVRRQAELAEHFSRSELTPMGTEWEQASHSTSGVELLGPEYSWLSTIMASGKDPNEIVTSPTHSAALQAIMLQRITGDGFLNRTAVDQTTAAQDTSCSSLHINFSLPNDVEMGPTASNIFAPIRHVNWLIHGGDKKQKPIAKGRESGWQGPALLDTMGIANQRRKWELRNIQIEPDNSHLHEAEDLQAVASAGIQRLREVTGRPTTASGKVLAGIFEQFIVQAEKLQMNTPGVEIRARELMARTAQLVRDELSLEQFTA